MFSHKPSMLAITLALCLSGAWSSRTSAQLCGGLGGANGTNSAATAGSNGVIVDAAGVLRIQESTDPTGQLQRQRIAAARAKLDPKVAMTSKLRLVSLKRLEAALQARLSRQLPATDEMKYLAGLMRLSYVFFYPETEDIVIAGPAEAWVEDLENRRIGIESARPVLELQDLIVALRAFAPGAPRAPTILCSIDPTPEGLARMQDFLRSIGSHATPSDTETIVNGLRTTLGMQNIRIGGIAANTHFAQVLLEADYRMKLIGIGLEEAPVNLKSYVDRANPGQVSHSALQRWYFIPEYKCVKVSPDEMAMQLVGDGVRLVGEDQVVAHDGSRQVTKRTNGASQNFVKDFTRKYADIAARLPVYAQLRNVIDMAVAAAFIQQQDYYAKAGWRMEAFGNEAMTRVETYNTPLHVETVVNSLWKGNHLLTPVGGGVTIQPTQALLTSNRLSDDAGKLSEVRDGIHIKALPAGQWWWDADIDEPVPAKKKGAGSSSRKASR